MAFTAQRRQPGSTLEFESADGRSLAEQPAGKSIRLSPLEGAYRTGEPQVPSSCSKSLVSFSGTRRRRVAGLWAILENSLLSIFTAERNLEWYHLCSKYILCPSSLGKIILITGYFSGHSEMHFPLVCSQLAVCLHCMGKCNTRSKMLGVC